MQTQRELFDCRNPGRHLFEVQKDGRLLGMAIRGRGWLRHYIGYINGQVCAVGPEKGELWRMLLDMAPNYPTA